MFYPKTILGARSFVITSPSMEPTLLYNDKCVAKIFASKDKNIDYGDIVIYKIPDDQTFYTGRIVSLPGDSLEIKNDFLIINNKEPVTSLVKGNSEGFETKLEVTEMLPNGKIIHIYKLINAGSEVSYVPKFKIPFNTYYIMGDNRGNSYDSRFRGSIPEKDIYGKFLYTFWGEKWDRINIDLTEN